MESITSTQLEITVKGKQLAVFDEFKRMEGLPSREATLNLLLEIALEVVTGIGDRFWDKSAPTSKNKPPRR